MSAIDSPQLKKRKMSSEQNGEIAPLAPVSNLLIKRHSEKAKLPSRGSALAAGYDLYRYASSRSSSRQSAHSGYLGTVLKRKSFLRVAKPSSTRRFLSLSPLGHMDGWHLGVALVRASAP